MTIPTVFDASDFQHDATAIVPLSRHEPPATDTNQNTADESRSLNAYRWLVSLIQKLGTCSEHESANLVADGIRVLCGSQLTALAVSASRDRLVLSGTSPPSAIDRQSELVRSIENVISDAVDQARHDGNLYELDLADMNSTDVGLVKAALRAAHLRVFFLRAETGIIAACLSSGIRHLPTHIRGVLPAVCQALGTQLKLRRQARPTPPIHWLRKVIAPARKHSLLALAMLVLIVVELLLIPVPLRVSCDCTAQPKIRRFVSIPYEGRLEEVLAEPGDVVTQGQTIARMDAREIRLELSAIEAEYHRTQKQRDMAMANRDTATTQIAALELERLMLQNQQLEDRIRNLDIKSPIAGVVISGDPRKLEGARFSMGQILAEIGQLETMRIEVAIPDDEIARVAAGGQARVKLDAVPGTTLPGELLRIHPRAELREGHNVFMGEVKIDGAALGDIQLRPGMNGRAKIIGARYPVAWILFHRAWEQVVYRIGW